MHQQQENFKQLSDNKLSPVRLGYYGKDFSRSKITGMFEYQEDNLTVPQGYTQTAAGNEAHAFRDYNGQFGSYPLYDRYDSRDDSDEFDF